MATSVTSLGGSSSGDAWTRDSGNNYVEGWKIGDIANYLLGVNHMYFNQPVRFSDYVTNYGGLFSGMTRMRSNIYFGNGDNLYTAYMLNGASTFNAPVPLLQRNISTAEAMFNGCSSFNQPIDISKDIGSARDMFSGCTSLNQPISINANIGTVWNAVNMFLGCTSLNQEITITKFVNCPLRMFMGCSSLNSNIALTNINGTADYIFNGCSALNSNITLGGNITSVINSFDKTFNGSVTFMGNVNLYRFMENKWDYNNFQISVLGNVTGGYNAFWNCINFNQPINIIGGNICNMFFNCTNFNQPIYFGAPLTNANHAFEKCYNLSQPISINYDIDDGCGMFSNMSNFNKSISINGNINVLTGAFNNIGRGLPVSQQHFSLSINGNINNGNSIFGGFGVVNNFDVTINGNVGDANNMFAGVGYDASNSKRSVTLIGDFYNPGPYFWQIGLNAQRVFNITGASFGGNCYETFGNTSFPHSINFSKTITNAEKLFYNCTTYNYPVDITISGNANNAFYNCSKFNSQVILRGTISNGCNMFNNCKNMSKNIYITGSIGNAYRFINGRFSSYRINIFCSTLTKLKGNAASNSITGTAITWEAITNGYRNNTYNIYLYNNVPSL